MVDPIFAMPDAIVRSSILDDPAANDPTYDVDANIGFVAID